MTLLLSHLLVTLLASLDTANKKHEGRRVVSLSHDFMYVDTDLCGKLGAGLELKKNIVVISRSC